MKKHQIFHVGEDAQADAVWFAMHHTTADEIAMGHAFVNPGDKLPYPGDYVVAAMDGYTVCLRVTKSSWTHATIIVWFWHLKKLLHMLWGSRNESSCITQS